MCTFFYNSMCVSIENIIQKKNCQSSRWTQLSNGYLLPEAQPLQPFAFNPGQKKSVPPKRRRLGATTQQKKTQRPAHARRASQRPLASFSPLQTLHSPAHSLSSLFFPTADRYNCFYAPSISLGSIMPHLNNMVVLNS